MGGIQVPTPSVDPLTPSTATLEPEPELWWSNHIADWGTRPNYHQLHNQSMCDQAVFTCKKGIQLEKTKQSMVANKTTKPGHITPKHEMLWMHQSLDKPILEHTEPTLMCYDKIIGLSTVLYTSTAIHLTVYIWPWAIPYVRCIHEVESPCRYGMVFTTAGICVKTAIWNKVA